MFRLLNRLEANLCNTILIYPNNTRANWILVLGVNRPQLIILARLWRRKIADTNHATLTTRLPRDRRFRIRWSRRGRREREKRRLHQGMDGADVSELAFQPYAIYSEQTAKNRQPRGYGPWYPA